MSRPSLFRRPGVLAALILVLTGISVWINWPRPPRLDLPRLDAQALGGVTCTAEDDHRILVHLSSLLYSDGRLLPWTRLPERSRPLWATMNFELELQAGSAFLQRPARDGEPTVPEIADSYQTLGVPELAALLRDLVPQFAEAAKPGATAKRGEFDRRVHALLPQARKVRLAYIQLHADEIARP